jgi:hypothetical protein
MSDDPTTEEEAEKPPQASKKKRKKRPREGSAGPATKSEATVEPSTQEPSARPGFADGWPSDPELDRLVSEFERGNYAAVREGAQKLAAQTKDPAVKEAALSLRKRIDPDPLAVALLAIAACLLVFFAWSYLGHRAPADAPGPPTPKASASQRVLAPSP